MVKSRNEKSWIFTKIDFQKGNTVNKAYFVVFGKVFNLTSLIEEKRNTVEADNMIDWIAKDISHFFDPETKFPI